MATFLFSYRVPNVSLEQRLAEIDPAAAAEGAARWNAWIESLGTSLIDRGNRVSDARALGNCNDNTRPGGYSLVVAEDLEAAVELARGCPGLEMGGGVEVGVIPELQPSTS
jgi:hypothetical protein